MLGHERIRRSVQLRSTYRGGKAKEVTLNRHLENEPSGCVIWMMFDKDTLELGPFLWLGGPPGEPLPELDGKVGQHTKGDRNGVKAERPNTRIVPKNQFRRLATIEEVAAALFGWLGAATKSPGREAAHRAILLRHPRASARSYPLPDDDDREWLERARRGDSPRCPRSSISIAPTCSRISSMGIGWPNGRGSAICRTSTGRAWPRRSARDLERNRPGALAGAVCGEQGYSPWGV